MSKIQASGETRSIPPTGEPSILENITDAKSGDDTAEVILFESENLKQLEKSISLTNEEKVTINKLNKCNEEMMKILYDRINNIDAVDYLSLEELLNSKIAEEKKIIQEELDTLIKTDKTGRKVLQIFEAIVALEMQDKNFSTLQQRKAISIADYFINKQITDMEQASYICDKGIVEKKIECTLEKIKDNINNSEEYKKANVIFIYEKALLNNYNKARSKIKDEYFKNTESKELIPPEIVIIVANNMPKQAYKIITKLPNLTLQKEIELEAVLKLLSTQQLGSLMMLIEKISDGKLRKMAIRKIKEITK